MLDAPPLYPRKSQRLRPAKAHKISEQSKPSFLSKTEFTTLVENSKGTGDSSYTRCKRLAKIGRGSSKWNPDSGGL